VEWEWCLAVACALVRGSNKGEDYQMSLEENRTTRDYLFGRLLAIAENIEERALYLAKETRYTNAAKLMQRFADHPCSTWKTIATGLYSYKARLRTNRPSVLREREKLLDEVMGMFRTEEFISPDRLTGEFLLGYHCQRAALWPKGKQDEPAQDEDALAVEGDKE
jgi:CRISPR-associated protein Csd1